MDIKKFMKKPIKTQDLLRMWKRRLLVALTDEEKIKCKAKIKLYKRN